MNDLTIRIYNVDGLLEKEYFHVDKLYILPLGEIINTKDFVSCSDMYSFPIDTLCLIIYQKSLSTMIPLFDKSIGIDIG